MTEGPLLPGTALAASPNNPKQFEARFQVKSFWLEWLIILVVVFAYSREATLDFDPHQLQQTGEQNESATLPILAEIALSRYGEIPRWNPYMLTGFPLSGDLISHFWNPITTLPVVLFGGVNGMKVSIFLSLLVAAIGQWFLAHTFGVRGMFRLWAALLFALSGGVALLSWLGWYELLVGIAWFPVCFALWWLALQRHDYLSVVLAAAAIFMILTTGGGYYPFYLGVCLVILTCFALLWVSNQERLARLKRTALIAVLALGLSAVYWVPLVNSLRLTARDAPPDVLQLTSQPLAYALFNFVVSDPAWLRADLLNKGSGNGWYYVGVLPLLALAFLPWLYARARWRRHELLTLLTLLLILLLWQANRHWPVNLLYDALSILNLWRFPSRLLIVATIPLLILSAMSLQGLLVGLRGRFRRERQLSASGMASVLPTFIAGLVLLASAYTAYQTNQPLATAPHIRNQTARATLEWLRQQDADLYYVDIGGTQIYWDWMPYAYEMEMPVLNFRYNRRLRSMDQQFGPDSPFRAQPRYTLLSEQVEPPPDAILLNTFNGVNVWKNADALPFAFATTAADGPFDSQQVVGENVRLDGPNRVVVTTGADTGVGQLVVLVSNYPGWQLLVNGQAAPLRPVNGYLGAELLPGEQVYIFEFRPISQSVGILISLLTAALCLGLVGLDWRRARSST